MCHFGREVEHKYFIPESVKPNIVKSFFYVKKSSGSHHVLSLVEAFHNRLGEPK